MSELTSFRSVIELWPSREALAADLPGATAVLVSKWWQRRSIPSDWWAILLSTERAKDAGVTADLLTGFASREEVRA